MINTLVFVVSKEEKTIDLNVENNALGILSAMMKSACISASNIIIIQ